MSQKIHWLNAVSGSFTNPGDWSGGVVPGATDKAVIDAVGADPYTVTSAVDETVRTLQTGAEATLAVTGGTFTATDGTGSAKQGNAGVILIGAGATFAAGGTIANSGTITLDGPTGKTGQATLAFDTKTTLTGGGEILLGGGGGNLIDSAGRYVFLYNTDNTIVGSGTIGGKHLLVINDQGGAIDANGSVAMVLKSNIDNSGLIEATGGGKLLWNGTFNVLRPSGVLLAGDGSSVIAHESRLTLGTIASTGSGVVEAYQTYVGLNLTNDSDLIASDCNFSGTITNNGTISLATGNSFVRGYLTLEGDGVIEFSGSGIVSYFDAPMTLSSGLLEGDGVVGVATLTVGAAGIIDNNTAGSLALISSAITNEGLIGCTGAGVLAIGTASAPEAIANTGTLSVSGTGTLIAYGAVTGNGVARIGGGTMDFASSFNEMVAFTGPGGVLELAQSQSYTKAISGFSASGQTSLDLGDIGFVGAGQATFSGTATSGVLTVTDGTHTAHITFKGDYRSTTFVAAADGHGGTDVTAQAAGAARPPHALIAAMASLGAAAGQGLGHTGAILADRPALLLAPRPAMA